MGIRRRRFLMLGAGTAVGVVATLGLSRGFRGNPSAVIVAILERRLGYLQIDRGSLDRFAADYIDTRKRFSRELSLMSLFALPYRYVTPHPWLKRGHALRRLEDNVVSRYLLSTDFFENGANETRPVAYVEFHDPYSIACRNPFVPRPSVDGAPQAAAAPRT